MLKAVLRSQKAEQNFLYMENENLDFWMHIQGSLIRYIHVGSEGLVKVTILNNNFELFMSCYHSFKKARTPGFEIYETWG